MTKKTIILGLLFVSSFAFAQAPSNSSSSKKKDTAQSDGSDNSKKPKAPKKDLKAESKAAATGEDKFIPITQIGAGISAYGGKSDGHTYSSAGGSIFAAFGLSSTFKLFVGIPFLQYTPETKDFAAIGDMTIGFNHTAYNGVKNGKGSKFAWGVNFGFPTGSAVAENTSNDYTITGHIGYLYVQDNMNNSNLGFAFQFQVNYSISLYDGNGLVYDSNTDTYSNRAEKMGTIDSQMVDSEYQFNFFLWKGGSISITPHIGYTITNTNGGTPLSVSLGLSIKQMINKRLGFAIGGKYSFVGDPLHRYHIGLGFIYLLS